MPTAIFLSRVSAASAFCSAICEPEFQVPASISKLDIVQSCQVKFQSIVAAFQESSDPVKPGNAFDLQRSTSEFESLCSELNVPPPHCASCYNHVLIVFFLAGSFAQRVAGCISNRLVYAATQQLTMTCLARRPSLFKSINHRDRMPAIPASHCTMSYVPWQLSFGCFMR